ncbi:MAG: CvpA family protein [Endozoicomonadaceae bacterium]|nr:CvpA family protein [Endozoicomonadaceae bacterium]
MALTWIDWIIVGIVVISSLISLRRGFFREVMSLLIWVAAAMITWLFSDTLSHLLVDYIDTPSLRKIIAAASLFVLTLISGGIINILASQLVKIAGLTGTDLSLGIVFGGLRGVLIVVILVGLTSYFPIEQDQWWSDSMLISHFEEMVQWSKLMLRDHVEPVVIDYVMPVIHSVINDEEV